MWFKNFADIYILGKTSAIAEISLEMKTRNWRTQIKKKLQKSNLSNIVKKSIIGSITGLISQFHKEFWSVKGLIILKEIEEASHHHHQYYEVILSSCSYSKVRHIFQHCSIITLHTVLKHLFSSFYYVSLHTSASDESTAFCNQPKITSLNINVFSLNIF